MKLAFAFLTVLSLVLLNGGAAAQVDYCQSTAVLNGGGVACWPSCPVGDGNQPVHYGWFISITVVDMSGVPLSGVLATDIWVEDCDPLTTPLVPCGGPVGASSADGPTDVAGMTKIATTTFAVSGCGGRGAIDPGDALRVFVQGRALQNPLWNCADLCLPVMVRSFDITEDGEVGLGDLSRFAVSYLGGTPDTCVDFDCSGGYSLVDFILLSNHYITLHPGHTCP